MEEESWRKGLTTTVETVVAVTPGQLAGERSKGVKERPGKDDIVIDGHQRRHHNHSPTQSCQEKTQTLKTLTHYLFTSNIMSTLMPPIVQFSYTLPPNVFDKIEHYSKKLSNNILKFTHTKKTLQ